MLQILESIAQIVVDVINSLGFFGVAAGMMIESACIPLPSELILPLAGNMADKGILTLLSANIAAAAGSLIGSLLAYLAGYYGGRPFIIKYGKYFFLSKDHFDKADKTFNKYGNAAVFFGRLLPIIRTFISLPAGIARLDLKKFLLYSTLGMIPWNFMLIYLGYELGQKYESVIRPIFKKFEYIVAAIIILTIIFFIVRAILKHIRKRREKSGMQDNGNVD